MLHLHRLTLRLTIAAVTLVGGFAGSSAAAQQLQLDSVNNPFAGPPYYLEQPLTVTPLVWNVIATPIYPVKGTDQRIHLAYEMLLTNISGETVRLESIEVVDPTQGNRVVGANKVVTIKDEDVTQRFRPLGQRRASTLDGRDFSNLLQPGRSAYLYLDVSFDHLSEVPFLIKHRVTFTQRYRTRQPVTTVGIGELTKVSRTEAVVLSPPLKGDRWVDASGCCEVISPHRHTILPLNGTLQVPERYAIDFIQIDEDGRALVGDIDNGRLEDWPYYGAEVIAAASGKVVEVVNHLKDEVPGQLPSDATVQSAPGNHVIVDIGNGRFILYAHLIPGSVAVSIGDVVERGQRLGQLGNSGNTDGPHLHFQVMDRPSALDANGLPFVFDSMELQGRSAVNVNELNDRIFGGRPLPISPVGSGPRHAEMPLTLDIVGFK